MRPPFHTILLSVSALIAASIGFAGCGASSPQRSAAAYRLPGPPRHSSAASGGRRGRSSTARGANTLVVQNTPVAQAIAPGFVGLSLGYKAIELDAGTDPNRVDPVFEQLVRNLAPGQRPVLRIAGADEAWSPLPGVRRPGGIDYNLTKRRLGVMRALAQALNARLIPSINFEADSATLAAAEAQALLNGIGRQWVDSFELGNEPELYGTFAPWYHLPNGKGVFGRPPSWSFGDFVKDFSKISRALPRQVTVAGPATGALEWFPLLRRFMLGNPRVGLVTVHRYPLKHCPPNVPITVSELLSKASTTGLAKSVAHAVLDAHARRIPLRVAEMNSISCGGMRGVSDSFASALWGLDALFAMARVNVDGVNIHTARNVNQLFDISRVDGRWQAVVRPLYYGLMMFTEAAPAGSRMLALSGTVSNDVSKWATQTPGGDIHVVLINDDTRHVSNVTIRVHAAVGSPTLERLVSSSVHGVTLGGQSFGSRTYTGQLAGSTVTVPVTPASAYHISLPAASATMLTFPAAKP